MWQYVPGPNIALGGSRPGSKGNRHHEPLRIATGPGAQLIHDQEQVDLQCSPGKHLAGTQTALDRISALYERISVHEPTHQHHQQRQAPTLQPRVHPALQGIQHQPKMDVIMTKLQRLSRPYAPVYKPVSVLLDRSKAATQPAGTHCSSGAGIQGHAPVRRDRMPVPKQHSLAPHMAKEPAVRSKKVKEKKKKKKKASALKRQAPSQPDAGSVLLPPLPPLPTSKYAWCPQPAPMHVHMQQLEQGQAEACGAGGLKDQGQQQQQPVSLAGSRELQGDGLQANSISQPVALPTSASVPPSTQCSPCTADVTTMAGGGEQQPASTLLPALAIPEIKPPGVQGAMHCACTKVIILREQATQTEPEVSPQQPQTLQEQQVSEVQVAATAQDTGAAAFSTHNVAIQALPAALERVHYVPTGIATLNLPELGSCSPLPLSWAWQQPSPQVVPAVWPCEQQVAAAAPAAKVTQQDQAAPVPATGTMVPVLQSRPRLSLADELRQMGVPIDGTLAELLAASPLSSPAGSEVGDDTESWSWEKELRRLGISE